MKLFILIFVLFSMSLFSNKSIDKDVIGIEKRVSEIEAIIASKLKNKNIRIEKTGNKDRSKELFYIKSIKFKEVFYHEDGKMESFYNNDKLMKRIFIREKRIASIEHYKNEENKVKSTFYNDDKNIYSENFYKNGREVKSITYNDDKSILSIRLYIGNEYIKTMYNKDGKIDSKIYSKYEEQGKAYKKIDYYKTGEVFDYHQPKDYPETHEVYKKLVKKAENDGEKFEKRTMLTLHDGIHTTYYKNGKKRRNKN